MRIDKKELAEKLSKLKIACEKKSTVEAMQGILFKNNTLTAYNYDIGITTSVNTDTDECFIVPLKAIELIQRLPSGWVDITAAENNSIIIKTATTRNAQSSYNPQDFPELPQFTEGDEFVINGEELGEILGSVIFAAAVKDELRPALSGIYFDSKGDGKLNVVGSDGVVLAWGQVDYGGKVDVVVPRQAVQNLLSIGCTGDIKIKYNLRQILFETGDYSMISRTISTGYLPYKQAVPKIDQGITLTRRELIESLERCIVSTAEKKSKVILSIAGKELDVSTNTEQGEYNEKIDLEETISQEVRIGFNTRFLIDVLKFVESDVITINIKNGKTPATICDGNLIGMIMPVIIK